MSGPFGSTTWMSNPSTDFYEHEINKSLRFEDGDDPTLRRTPGTAGNRKTWTTSCWVKRANLGSGQRLGINSGTSNTKFSGFNFNSDDTIQFFHRNNTSDSYGVKTNRVFRDTSSWYHFVLVADTTQSTAANRIKMFVNGEQVLFPNEINGTNGFPSQNQDMEINNTAYVHTIGADWNGDDKFDGYHADITHIDGLALTPSSFGELKNDIWIPKNTSGLTFGTNGFRLEFKQVGTGTASSSTIGADTSGETNHYTSANLVASDVMPDTPTNNWCVVNSLANDPSYPLTFSEGNLKTAQTNKYNAGLSSFVITKEMGGKWYMEVSSLTDGNFPVVGVTSADILDIPSFVNSTGVQGNSYEYSGYDGGRRSPPGSGVGTLDNGGQYRHQANWGDTFNQDVLSIALDWDNKKVYFGKNGTWQDSGNPAGNANPAFSSMQFDDMVFHINDGAGADNRDSTFIFNFGQDGTFAGTQTAAGNADDNGFGDFLYDVPAGFLSLCAKNLPDPVETIDPSKGGSPQNHFNTVLYAGNGGDANSPQGITGVGFQPDFVWGKNRSAGKYHYLNDSVRGVGATSFASNDDIVEEDVGFDAFGSDGFSVSDIDSGTTNENGNNYVAWNWKAGTAFSNDASSTSVGSLDSSGVVNTDIGFSIIKWTAVASSATQTMAHGLGAVPKMIMIKNRERDVNWAVYHVGIGNTHGLELNTTAAPTDDTGWWNDTTPTSTVFTTGNGNGYRTGGIAEDYLAYCFANVNGYSKFGSYTGNGNANGSFVYTGFRPAFIMIKRTNTTGGWHIHDNKRNTGNLTSTMVVLSANFADQEYAHVNYQTDFLSNGFKLRNTTNEWNGSGNTHVYMAFAEQPFKYANAR